MSGRWVIQRAGYPGDYEPGWFAFAPNDQSGCWQPTFEAAVEFVSGRLQSERREAELSAGLARIGVKRDPRGRIRPVAPITPAELESRHLDHTAFVGHAKPGTIDVAKLIDLHAAGMANGDIAKYFTVTPQAVGQRLKKLGLEHNGTPRGRRHSA